MSTMNWNAEIRDLETQIKQIKARIKSLKASIQAAGEEEDE